MCNVDAVAARPLTPEVIAKSMRCTFVQPPRAPKMVLKAVVRHLYMGVNSDKIHK